MQEMLVMLLTWGPIIYNRNSSPGTMFGKGSLFQIVRSETKIYGELVQRKKKVMRDVYSKKEVERGGRHRLNVILDYAWCLAAQKVINPKWTVLQTKLRELVTFKRRSNFNKEYKPEEKMIYDEDEEE